MTIQIRVIRERGKSGIVGTLEDISMGEIIARRYLAQDLAISRVEFIEPERGKVIGDFDRFEVSKSAYAKFAPEAPKEV